MTISKNKKFYSYVLAKKKKERKKNTNPMYNDYSTKLIEYSFLKWINGIPILFQ